MKKNKKILGLDLGTNSVGWALVEIDHEIGVVKILGLGTRILPMNKGEINDFESNGKIKSNTSQRTDDRGIRRLRERYLLRRDRLHLALDLLNSLPEHYRLEIDFERKGGKCGQFRSGCEPKLAYKKESNSNKYKFLFEESYQEMIDDMNIVNEKGSRVPYDWTLYYLRQKALKEQITLEELAWVLLSYNQKRGYEKTEAEEKVGKENELVESLDLQVQKVTQKVDDIGKKYFEIQLDGIDEFTYKEYSNKQVTFEGDLKEVEKTSNIDELGNVKKGGTTYKITDIYTLKIVEVKYENKESKHSYTIIFDNGWELVKQPKKYTSEYKYAESKSYDYIVVTSYKEDGELVPKNGKDRNIRMPKLDDKENDWTLLKKKTEKRALEHNLENGYYDLNTKEPKKYISTHIYTTLKLDAETRTRTKIIGGMFQVVDREFYREELKQIIYTQKKYHTCLEDKEIFEKCVNILYPNNKAHAKSLLDNKSAIEHLLIEDIILYQRQLKSKKSEIGDCKFEIEFWKKDDKNVDKTTGEIPDVPVYKKAVSTSHPYFQEFRIWDKLHNLRLIQLEKKDEKGKINTYVDVTNDYFKTEDDFQSLYDKLNNQKTLSKSQFLEFCEERFSIEHSKMDEKFSWNFPEDEELKGNETRVTFVTRFKRCGFSDYDSFLTAKKERDLWHYLYSVKQKEREANNNKSIKSFFKKFLKHSGISDDVKSKIIEDFTNYPKFPSKYCAYSEKALKKLIPLMRINGDSSIDSWQEEKWYKKWNETTLKRKKEILEKVKQIDFEASDIDFSKVIKTNVDLRNGEIPFPKGLFNTFKNFTQLNDFVKLNLTQASYLVYGRHSELAHIKRWCSPSQIRNELHKELRQHSLNNPIAEKVILEMMQVVADIWETYGKENQDDSYQKLFDKIHIEVGRELKKSAKEKEATQKNQTNNKKQNKRIRKILEEYLANKTYNANPRNQDHFERLKSIENGAEHRKNIDKDFFNDKPYNKKEIEDILKKTTISKDEFDKYKLWISQGYRSPYTNKTIQLTNLFDPNKYNIDHVFPQASITNDSLSNKVVCEKEVNSTKSGQTGRDFIINPKQREIYCNAHGGQVKIVDDEVYVSIVKSQFSGTKRMILLSKDIPKGFTSSQMNNARYISRKAMELLSHIVREEDEVEFRSKHVLPVTGVVTSKLKKAWGLDGVWRELVSPRFKRMNELTKSNLFGQEMTSKSGHKYFDCKIHESILEENESYDIKRIDYRHNAMDALIVALCTEEHVNYFNNYNAKSQSDDYGKQKRIEKYRSTLKKKIQFTKERVNNEGQKDWYYMLPGETRLLKPDKSNRDSVLSKKYFFKELPSFGSDFRKMILTSLQYTIVSFKQNMRVINNTVNRYNKTPDKKDYVKQIHSENGSKKNWSIRKSLGKKTFYGKVNLKRIEKKKLHSSLDIMFDDPFIIYDKDLKKEVINLKERYDLETCKGKLIQKYPKKEHEIDLYYYSKSSSENSKVANREFLDNRFDVKKIKTITDTGIQKILINHLRKFDTVQLSFEDGLKFHDALLEKEIWDGIVNNEDNEFKDQFQFIEYLKANNYKYDKTDFSNLNVFIDKVKDRKDFRGDSLYTEKISENPKIAFSANMIDVMNSLENLRSLNGGKKHAPIIKVRVSRALGKKRLVSDNIHSVKSKQYIENDASSNLYLGVYERKHLDEKGNEVRNRIFQSIELVDLIDYLKKGNINHHNPFPNKAIDKENNEYDYLFSLSPSDLVYVPTEEEQKNPSLIRTEGLTRQQLDRIYKYVDGSEGHANFILPCISFPIWKFHGKEKKNKIFEKLKTIGKLSINKKELIQDEIGGGSPQTKSQNTIDGSVQIKTVCWKLKIGRLGNLEFIK